MDFSIVDMPLQKVKEIASIPKLNEFIYGWKPLNLILHYISHPHDWQYQGAIFWLLLTENKAYYVTTLLRKFKMNQLPTSLLEFLFDKWKDKKTTEVEFIFDNIVRLCSISKQHPHYMRFQQLLKQIVNWKIKNSTLWSLDPSVRKIRDFNIILDLVSTHRVPLWDFDYLFSEEELALLLLVAPQSQIPHIRQKIARLRYRIEDHYYCENYDNLKRMKKNELLYLCRRYRLKRYSHLNKLGIMHLLLTNIPSKPGDPKPVEYKIYWLEDHDFFENLKALKKMSRRTLILLCHKYWIRLGYFLSNWDLIKLLLDRGYSTDSKNQPIWQTYWLEDHTLEENYDNMAQMTRSSLIKIGKKYGITGLTKLRKNVIILKILDRFTRGEYSLYD